MKRFVVVVIALLAPVVCAETLAQRAAALIASADSAGICGEMEKKEKEVVVRDAKWIRDVSEVVGKSDISGSVACFCSGWRTVTFYKKGEFVVSLAAIHGNQLRIFSQKGGGDFPIAEARWNAVKAVLEVHKAANQITEPTPLSSPPSDSPRASAPVAPIGHVTQR